MKHIFPAVFLAIAVLAATLAVACAENTPPAASPSGSQPSDSDGGAAAAPAPEPARHGGGW
jgi:hypothetical protein